VLWKGQLTNYEIVLYLCPDVKSKIAPIFLYYKHAYWQKNDAHRLRVNQNNGFFLKEDPQKVRNGHASNFNSKRIVDTGYFNRVRSEEILSNLETAVANIVKYSGAAIGKARIQQLVEEQYDLRGN